jgi:hypothetical protein
MCQHPDWKHNHCFIVVYFYNVYYDAYIYICYVRRTTAIVKKALDITELLLYSAIYMFV